MSDDSVNSSVVESSTYILRFGFLVEVCAEMVFFCYIYVDVIGESRCGSVMRLVSSGVRGMKSAEFLRLINGLIKGQGLCNPVDRGVGFSEPG